MWRWLRLSLTFLALLALSAGSQPRLCPEMANGQACWSHACGSSAGDRLALAYMCHPEGLAHQAARGSWAPSPLEGQEAQAKGHWAIAALPWRGLLAPCGLSPPAQPAWRLAPQAGCAPPLPPPRA